MFQLICLVLLVYKFKKSTVTRGQIICNLFKKNTCNKYCKENRLGEEIRRMRLNCNIKYQVNLYEQVREQRNGEGGWDYFVL